MRRRTLLASIAGWSAAAATARDGPAADAAGAGDATTPSGAAAPGGAHRTGRPGDAAPAADAASATDGALTFPRDFGAHPDARIEWWYLTGALDAGARTWGFQVTFFRAATGLATTPPSRFAASQLLFAHAALTDLAARRLRHDQRIARSGFGIAEAGRDDTDVALRDWRLARSARPGAPARSRYVARVASDAAGFALALRLDATQPVLLQGDRGVSTKAPAQGDRRFESRYYSEPQLAVDGTLVLDGATHAVGGRAWLDHEWSDAFMPPQAVGWDWIGINLDDGGALTAFRLRRADGSALYAGGSLRSAAGARRAFDAGEVRFVPGRRWHSATSGASYPVEWQLETPAGRHRIVARLDAQELDSRASTGAFYWEGLSDLLDADGRRVGRGYLEMTGYATTLRL